MGGVYIFFKLYLLSCISFTVAALPLASNVHCAVRREISPCTCHQDRPPLKTKKEINVICEGMTSFQQVISALQGKFENDVDINLKISHSALDDLPQLSFQTMGINIQQLRLQHDNLSAIPESVFSGMGKAELVSLSDNILTTIPQNVLQLMPRLKTLDISRTSIANITSSDFQGLPLSTLILAANNISLLEVNSLPSSINKLHIGRNRIRSLNGTLRCLTDLEWVFMNNNHLETLDGELPDMKPNKRLTMIQASYNNISSLPQELKDYAALNILGLNGNRIKFLRGAIANAKKLRLLELNNNNIEKLESDDFANLENLEEIDLQYNYLTNLNKSILPLKNLSKLKISNNQLTAFNPSEIRGLMKLKYVDFSHNFIHEISAKDQNFVEPSAKVEELRLEFNKLNSLEGSIGLQIIGLTKLNISHNLLESIGPLGLEGLKELECLDLSHNKLFTLGDTSQTILPSLDDLRVSFNSITRLEEDFYGFPHLCWADMSYNQIEDISYSLLDHTQCTYHGVNKTLRIYMQGNQALCNQQIVEKIKKIQNKSDVEVHGLNSCLPNVGTHTQTASGLLT